MVLREKLRTIKMHQGESFIAYLTRVQEVHDELAVVGEEPINTKLVCEALNGFTKIGILLFRVSLDNIRCQIGNAYGVTSSRRS